MMSRGFRSVLAVAAMAALGGGALQAREADAIGEAAQVVSEVRGIRGVLTRELAVEDDVFIQEVVETGPDAATRIVFSDGTELSMGPGSRVTLDRYVYDPGRGTGEMVISFLSGVFEFASGLMPAPSYDLRTPFANLSIRGTRLRFSVGQELQVTVREGSVGAREGDLDLVIDDQLDCLRWPAPGGPPERVPLTECQVLLEAFAVMTALLVEPAAGPAITPAFTPGPAGVPGDDDEAIATPSGISPQ